MTDKIKTDWRIVIAAIAGLVILECFAMYQGVNGKLFSLVIAIIAGLAGLVIQNPLKTK